MLLNAPGPEPFPGQLLETKAASCTPMLRPAFPRHRLDWGATKAGGVVVLGVGGIKANSNDFLLCYLPLTNHYSHSRGCGRVGTAE